VPYIFHEIQDLAEEFKYMYELGYKTQAWKFLRNWGLDKRFELW